MPILNEESEPELEKAKEQGLLNFGIVAISPETGDIYHLCGYKNPPTTIDYISLYHELSMETSTFDLKDKQYILAPAPEEVLDAYRSDQIEPDVFEIHNGDSHVN